MSHIRGLVISATTKYIQQNYGEEGWNKVLNSLEPQDREVLKGKFSPMSFYPVKPYINLMKAADKVFGKGDFEICRKIGIYEAEDTFSGVYKIFLELGNPNFLINKASLAWRTFHDGGALEIEQVGDKYAKGKIVDFPEFDKCFCVNLVGFFGKVLEMSGAKNLQIQETKCRCQGDKFCEYEIKWE